MIAIALVSVVFISGCKKDYFTNGGTLDIDQTEALGVSTMDYLKSRPEVFDTLTTLITLAGLEAEVNATVRRLVA